MYFKYDRALQNILEILLKSLDVRRSPVVLILAFSLTSFLPLTQVVEFTINLVMQCYLFAALGIEHKALSHVTKLAVSMCLPGCLPWGIPDLLQFVLISQSNLSCSIFCFFSFISLQLWVKVRRDRSGEGRYCCPLSQKVAQTSAVLLPCQFIILHVKQTRMANTLLPGTVL